MFSLFSLSKFLLIIIAITITVTIVITVTSNQVFVSAKGSGYLQLDSSTINHVVGHVDVPILLRFAKTSYNKIFHDFASSLLFDENELEPQRGSKYPLLAAKFECLANDQKPICDAFHVSAEDLPVLAIFDSHANVVKATLKGEIKDSDIIKKFVVENTGIYFGLPGQIKELAEISSDLVEFVSSKLKQNDGPWHDHDEAVKFYNKAAEIAEALKTNDNAQDDEDAKIYLSYMKKIAEFGNIDIVINERARITKLFDSKDVTQAKKDVFERRLNILSTFTINNNDKNINDAKEEL